VIETSNQATEAARAIICLFNKDRAMIEASGKSPTTTLTIYGYLQKYPISNSAKIKKVCDVTLPTVLRSLAMLENVGIVKEITGKGRHKIFVYKDYLTILNKGTGEP
jgi:Fic family protein